MNRIANLTRSEKRRLRIWIQRERDARMRTRLTIILHSSKGRSVGQTAAALDVARSTVYRVADRFIHWGWQGLADRREDNGASGVDELFLEIWSNLVDEDFSSGVFCYSVHELNAGDYVGHER